MFFELRFFSQLYASLEKGTNKNITGLIRQYFTENIYFSNLLISDIMFVENRFNSRLIKYISFTQPVVILNIHVCT